MAYRRIHSSNVKVWLFVLYEVPGSFFGECLAGFYLVNSPFRVGKVSRGVRITSVTVGRVLNCFFFCDWIPVCFRISVFGPRVAFAAIYNRSKRRSDDNSLHSRGVFLDGFQNA